MKQGTVSKSSIRILEQVKDNPGTTQTDIAENLGLSFTAVSRHFRKGYGYGFLDEIVEKQNGDDGREKKLYIEDGKEEDVEKLVDALDVIEEYGDGEKLS